MKLRKFSWIALLCMGCGTGKIANDGMIGAKGLSTAYTNPIMWADVPDLSVTRSGVDFYLISTTMHLMPGAPVMKSKDLVHWETVGYVFDRLEDTLKYDLLQGTVYGRGQWASSIRYHKGKFYVLFSPNDEPYRSYIYSSSDPTTNAWKLVSRAPHFHDASLFFDDDGRVYVFYGSGLLRELKPDLSGVLPGGIERKIFERDAEETGLLEGSQVVKHNNKYYLLMISWPKNGKRRQVCYRADNISGPYEKKIILEDNFAGFSYVAQGCIVDDEKGNWYALVFQDRDAVGRVPLLMPVRWINGWPMLGDENGKVPLQGEVPLNTYKPKNQLVQSDGFSEKKLKINWQWNHNPVKEAWSLADRPGCLRLKTSRVVDNLYAAPNTLTQRMEGPACLGAVSLDLANMKDGDVAGFAAFNGHSVLLSVSKNDGKKQLAVSTNIVELDDKTKAILAVTKQEKEKVELSGDIIHLRITADFNLNKDIARCYYSLDNKLWTQMGDGFKMRFDYKKLFMGTRFAIFNYATKALGGYVDVDAFNYERK